MMMNLLSSNSTRHSGSPKSSKRRTLNWRPRTAEEIVRKRNRKIVSQHLKKIGKAAGREMSLDEDAVCVFSFKKFVVVVEVPEDSSSIVLFHAKVCHMSPGDNREEAQKFLDAYNHRQLGSGAEVVDASSASDGTCPCVDPLGSRLRLSMADEEVNLCISVPIQGLSFEDMADTLEQFVKTAVAANRKLSKIKSIPTAPKPSLELLPEEAPQAPAGSQPRRARMWSVDSQCSISNMSQCSLFNLFGSSPTAPYTDLES